MNFSKRINYCILRLKDYVKGSKGRVHKLTDEEFNEIVKSAEAKYGMPYEEILKIPGYIIV